MNNIEKRKSFKAGFTKIAFKELVISIGICIILILFGLKSINKIEDIWSYDIAIGYLMVISGFSVISYTVYNYTKEFNQYIVISPRGIIYQKGELYFSEEWGTVKLITTKNNNSFMLKSTDSTITVKRKYFPKFDIILTILSMGMESQV